MKSGKTKEVNAIIHNPACRKGHRELNILRVQIWPQHTKVDFGYVAKNHYIRGGWVQIYENSFIRDCKTGKTYLFKRAENIPIAPQKHYFTSHWDKLYYSLYFEPMPTDVEKIDIIERENDDSTFFNFIGVELGNAQKDGIM